MDACSSRRPNGTGRDDKRLDGKALNGSRDKVFIATKFTLFPSDILEIKTREDGLRIIKRHVERPLEDLESLQYSFDRYRICNYSTKMISYLL